MGLTGVILSKMDGDARGGLALAIKATTGVPIKLAGVGERVEDLEIFDSKRMAQRIMGMGDMMGLMEKLERSTTEADVDRITDSFKKNRFTMEDMLLHIQQIKKLGPLDKVLEMLPLPGGVKALKGAEIDPSRIKHTEAIILSMTKKERRSLGSLPDYIQHIDKTDDQGGFVNPIAFFLTRELSGVQVTSLGAC